MCTAWVHLKSVLSKMATSPFQGSLMVISLFGGKMATSPFWGKMATSPFWDKTASSPFWGTLSLFYPKIATSPFWGVKWPLVCFGLKQPPVCFTPKQIFWDTIFYSTSCFASQRSFLRKTNEASVHICTCRMVEYRVNENVTSVFPLFRYNLLQ